MKRFRCVLALLCLSLLARSVPAGTLIQFHMFLGVSPTNNTYIGDIEAELYDQDKPTTVKNFLRLIDAGAFQNAFFHRLVRGFVLQGGSYQTVNPFATNIMAPPFSNIFATANFGMITNEFKVGAFRSNTNGTIAMAKTSDPNSATSGFFFNLANNASSLDDTNNSGGFTVFGHVLRDGGILNFFNSLFYGHGLVDLTKNYGTNGVFNELPNALNGTNPPPYNALIYYSVDILRPKIKVQTNGARQIIWNTIAGLTNNVEYTTNLPPKWQVLTNLVGNGAPITNIDSTTNNKSRFYRIHVLY